MQSNSSCGEPNLSETLIRLRGREVLNPSAENCVTHPNLFEVDAMKAAILNEFKEQLSIEEVARPAPGAHEVLIEVQACGVCHSDLHVANGDWPQIVPITKKPLILGHEITGCVVEKGASVNQLELGDRVGVPWCTGPAGNVNSVAR